MSIRAIWIIDRRSDSVRPFYSRYFRTVEARCKSVIQDLYVKIPEEEEFVKYLLTEVGLVSGDTFIESRDRPDKAVLFPALVLDTKLGNLGPVVVLENKGVLLCALTLETIDINKATSTAKLLSVPVALEVLRGLSECLSQQGLNLTLDSSAIPTIVQYISVTIPFGNPITCNPAIAKQLTTQQQTRGKTKQPFWNPIPYKGKPQVSFQIKEEARCMQFNHPEMKDVLEVYGTIYCKADVEGVIPEISVVITQPLQEEKSSVNISGNTCVSNIDVKGKSTKLRFHPYPNEPLCSYIVPTVVEAPIQGIFSVKVVRSIAELQLKLLLRRDVKNVFQQLDVHIPFTNCDAISVKPSTTQGSVSVLARNNLVWNVGSKFPSKTFEASLKAVVQFRQRRNHPETRSETLNSGPDGSAEAYKIQNISAIIVFEIPDYTMSGTKIDPQSVVISTASKLRSTVTSSFISGVYKIWNSDGNVTVTTNVPSEELEKLFLFTKEG